MSQPADQPKPWNWPLFDLMWMSYGMTLCESEMDDIIQAVEKCQENRRKSLARISPELEQLQAKTMERPNKAQFDSRQSFTHHPGSFHRESYRDDLVWSG